MIKRSERRHIVMVAGCKQGAAYSGASFYTAITLFHFPLGIFTSLQNRTKRSTKQTNQVSGFFFFFFGSVPNPGLAYYLLAALWVHAIGMFNHIPFHHRNPPLVQWYPNQLVSWCFEPSQHWGLHHGWKTNFNPSLYYSAHTSLNVNRKVSTTQSKYFT